MRLKAFLSILGAAVTLGTAQHATAQGFPMPDQGKFLATAGASTAEGAGGGALSAWSLITGYGTRDSYGANVHYGYINLQDFSLSAPGVAVGLFDRVELSYAYWDFKATGGALDGVKIKQDIFGVKVKVLGDAVYDQNTWVPQVAVGVQFKHNKGISGVEGLGVFNPTDLGAKKNTGTDFYVTATKIYLAQSLLVSGGVRFTKANQFGLLGFGGDLKDKYRAEFEGSIAYLIDPRFGVGAEYRTKPHNLGVDDERDWWDVFMVWIPNKNASLVVGYLDAGTILKPFNPAQQRGVYVSLQVGF